MEEKKISFPPLPPIWLPFVVFLSFHHPAAHGTPRQKSYGANYSYGLSCDSDSEIIISYS